MTADGFLQDPHNDVFLLVQEDVQIAIVSRNRYLVFFDDATDSRPNRRILPPSHASVADIVTLNEQVPRETPGAPVTLTEIPTDATVVAFARYARVQATIHSRQ